MEDKKREGKLIALSFFVFLKIYQLKISLCKIAP